MEPSDQLRFAISDRIGDEEVKPSHVPLGMLGEFQKDIADFLKGSIREVDPKEIPVSIEEGSLALRVSGLGPADNLWTDFQRILEGSIQNIDSKRAEIIEKWQNQAKNNPNRRYEVRSGTNDAVLIIDQSTNFALLTDQWVTVEKYIYGKIVDWGGKSKPNVHLELEDGRSITVDATQNQIAKEEHNLVYRKALLHVSAEENLSTGDLRNIILLSFEKHNPSFDENEFNLMVERGTNAWAEIEDIDTWLENLRGTKH